MKRNFTRQKGRVIFLTFLLGVLITSQIQGKNVLLGTAQAGGKNGKGTIFEYDPASHTYVAKFSFDGTTSGANPIGGLVAYKDKFYGTTSAGGTYDKGTIFEYDPVKASVRTLFSFNGGGEGLGGNLDGATPSGALLVYNDSLYGMTKYGGLNNNGVIFSINPSTGVYKKLFNFNNEVSGMYPCGGLTLFNNRLYGVTSDGGVKDGGTFFYWDLTSYSFVKKDDYDIYYHIGVNPFGSFIVYNNYMFITANKGGKNNKGVIYRYKDDEYDILYEFAGTDGEAPEATLTQYNGMIYGTTTKGGTNSGGVLFQLDPAPKIPTCTKKYDFASNATPRAALTAYNGYLYGSTSGGNGSIFEYNPTTATMNNILSLSTTNGTIPYYSALLIYNVRYQLAFTVSDGTNPLTGVTIKLTANNRVLPYNSSVYTIDTISGTYDYEISKPGYVTKKGTIVVNDADITQNITLSVAPEPFITTNKGLSILEGATASVTQDVLAASDMQQDVSALTYTINTALAHGRLEKTTAPGISLTTFMQTDINNGIIQYVNDGLTGTSDAFSFTVNDGEAHNSVLTTFTVSVTPVNDAPSFVKGADIVVRQNSFGQTISNWATSISAGGSDETSQTLKFRVSNDNHSLFEYQPAISSTGTLSFEPETDVNGVAHITVRLGDNGGTANGGADSSAIETFTITVSQLPYFSVSPQSVSVDAKGTPASVQVNTNVAWTATPDQSWLKVSPSSGNESAALSFTAEENTSTNSRTARVTVTGTDYYPVTVYVNQAGADPALSVSENSKTVPAASSQVSFDIVSNSFWTVTNSASWISMAKNSGTGNGALSLTIDENTEVTERIASIIIASGNLSQTITITQHGSTPQLGVSTESISLSSYGGSSSYFVVNSNTDWTASSSQSWLTINKTSGTGNATVTVTATANTTTSDRQAVVTISGGGKVIQLAVSQAFSGASLSVSASTLSLAASQGSSASFDITSNADWTVSCSQTWLNVNKGSGTGNSTVVVTASENTSLSERTAKITVVGSGTSIEINVTQAAGTASLSVSPDELSLAASEGSSGTFDIKSNVTWNVNSSASWLGFNKVSGDGNASVSVTASINSSTADRTATITISGGGLTRTMTVTQSFNGATLSVSPGSLSLAADGGTASFSITSNALWTVTTSESWLTFSKTSDTGNGTITVTAAANSSSSQRTAAIVVTGAGTTQQITITQAAATAVLNVASATLSVAASGGTASFSITSNVDWTISSAESWLTTGTASGSGNATVELNASVNTAASSRDAVVTISGSGITRTVTVTQAGGVNGVETITEEDVKVYPNPADDKITLESKQLVPSGYIMIYSVDGILLLSQKAEAKVSEINVSKLSAGTYLMKFNGSVVRFVKR